MLYSPHTACHPSLVAIPDDFNLVRKPLSLAVGTKDSLLDMGSVGKIQDLLATKTDVPHELQVFPPFSESSHTQNRSSTIRDSHFHRCTRTRSTASPFDRIGRVKKIRKQWMTRLNKA